MAKKINGIIGSLADETVYYDDDDLDDDDDLYAGDVEEHKIKKSFVVGLILILLIGGFGVKTFVFSKPPVEVVADCPWTNGKMTDEDCHAPTHTLCEWNDRIFSDDPTCKEPDTIPDSMVVPEEPEETIVPIIKDNPVVVTG